MFKFTLKKYRELDSRESLTVRTSDNKNISKII